MNLQQAWRDMVLERHIKRARRHQRHIRDEVTDDINPFSEYLVKWRDIGYVLLFVIPILVVVMWVVAQGINALRGW